MNESSAGTSKDLNQVSAGSQEPPKLKIEDMDRVEASISQILISKPQRKMVSTTMSAVLAKNIQNPSTSAISRDGKNIKINKDSTKSNVEGGDTSIIKMVCKNIPVK